MADIVSSLFGLDPNEIVALRQKEDQATALRYGQGQRNPGTATTGYGFGAGLSRGLMTGLGIQDPALEKATKLQQILSDTQSELGPDVNDQAKLYTNLQDKLNKGGFAQEAMQVGAMAQKAAQEQALSQAKIENETNQGFKYKAEALRALREDDPKQAIFKELAKNASPKSVAAAIANGFDIGLLDSPEKTKLSSYGQQLVDAGFKQGSPEFEAKMQEYLAAELSGKSKGSGNVSVSLGGVSINPKNVGEEAGKVVGKDAAAIEDQYAALNDFTKAKEMLAKGIFAGPYGPTEMKIAKNTRQNLGKVANTEKFKSYVANNVIKRLKDIGGNDTKEERDYLEGMIGGDITFEPSAIEAVINSGEEKIRNKLSRTKAQVEAASTGKPIPLNPVTPIKRWNPSTGKIEVVQ